MVGSVACPVLQPHDAWPALNLGRCWQQIKPHPPELTFGPLRFPVRVVPAHGVAGEWHGFDVRSGKYAAAEGGGVVPAKYRQALHVWLQS